MKSVKEDIEKFKENKMFLKVAEAGAEVKVCKEWKQMRVLTNLCS